MSDGDKNNEDQVRALQQKKEKFTRTDQPVGKNRRGWMAGVIIILAAIAVSWGLFGRQWLAHRGNTGTVEAEPGKDFRIPLAQLSDGQAKFFTYKLPGNKEVKFFAIKSPDGVMHAALDACEICFAARKGYRQEGNDMICNNCERHFPSPSLNQVSGECNPVPLTRRVEGDYLVISRGDLEKAVTYFYF